MRVSYFLAYVVVQAQLVLEPDEVFRMLVVYVAHDRCCLIDLSLELWHGAAAVHDLLAHATRVRRNR